MHPIAAKRLYTGRLRFQSHVAELCHVNGFHSRRKTILAPGPALGSTGPIDALLGNYLEVLFEEVAAERAQPMPETESRPTQSPGQGPYFNAYAHGPQPAPGRLLAWPRISRLIPKRPTRASAADQGVHPTVSCRPAPFINARIVSVRAVLFAPVFLD